jgi:hypothetical protein
MGKSDLDNFLDGYTVVGQQQFLAHANLLIPSARIVQRSDATSGK